MPSFPNAIPDTAENIKFLAPENIFAVPYTNVANVPTNGIQVVKTAETLSSLSSPFAIEYAPTPTGSNIERTSFAAEPTSNSACFKKYSPASSSVAFVKPSLILLESFPYCFNSASLTIFFPVAPSWASFSPFKIELIFSIAPLELPLVEITESDVNLDQGYICLDLEGGPDGATVISKILGGKDSYHCEVGQRVEYGSKHDVDYYEEPYYDSTTVYIPIEFYGFEVAEEGEISAEENFEDEHLGESLPTESLDFVEKEVYEAMVNDRTGIL